MTATPHRRFADVSPPFGERQPAQEPMDGDDRPLSSTTGRFRIYVDDVVVQREADVPLLVTKYALFDVTDPTVHQMREGFALLYGIQDQIRLVQLTAADPLPEPEEQEEPVPDPYAHLDPDDAYVLPAPIMPGRNERDRAWD